MWISFQRSKIGQKSSKGTKFADLQNEYENYPNEPHRYSIKIEKTVPINMYSRVNLYKDGKKILSMYLENQKRLEILLSSIIQFCNSDWGTLIKFVYFSAAFSLATKENMNGVSTVLTEPTQHTLIMTCFSYQWVCPYFQCLKEQL